VRSRRSRLLHLAAHIEFVSLEVLHFLCCSLLLIAAEEMDLEELAVSKGWGLICCCEAKVTWLLKP